MNERRDDDHENLLKQNFEQLGSDLGDAGREIAEKVKNIFAAKELHGLRDELNRTMREVTRGLPGLENGFSPRHDLRPAPPRTLVQKKGANALASRINKSKYGYGICLVKTFACALGSFCSLSAGGFLSLLAGRPELVAGFPLDMGMQAVTDSLQTGSGVFGFLTLLFGVLGLKSFSRLRVASVLKRYQEVIGDKSYYDLSALASKTGRDVRRVRKDFRKLMRHGGLYDCYLDNEEQTLIIGQETYQLYRESKAYSPPEEAEPPVEEPVSAEAPEDDPVQDLEINSAQFIAHIRAINEALPEKEISDKLDKLEQISSKIFRYVEKRPDKLPQIRKFMDYYLPTTLKLMEAYRELTGHGAYGEVEDTKAEIKSAMDKINHAFENLFGNLLRNDLLNLSADISALEAMLAQEGLSEDENSKI